jgi:hypothetical protein
MTIEESFNNCWQVATQTISDALNGDCGRNFTAMSNDEKGKTFLKVAVAAAAAGIVCGLICGTGGIISGAVSSVLVAAAVGSYMFCYFTNNMNCAPVEDFVNKTVKTVENKLESGMNKINNTINGWLK